MIAKAPIQPPLILVTNDDGVHSAGIIALAEAVSDLGEIVVVAPDQNRSGVSHMISLMVPLRCKKLKPSWWAVSGSPADCVYIAINSLLEKRPALVLSGINAGPNLSYDVHYSGTVGAAMEGTMLGIPSIALSLTDLSAGSFKEAARFARSISAHVLEHGLANNVTLNVNIPAGPPERYRMTFLGHRLFRHAVHKRADPRGGDYYWIGGKPEVPKDMPGSDCNTVLEGVISVTPLKVDPTDTSALSASEAFEIPGVQRLETLERPKKVELKFK